MPQTSPIFFLPAAIGILLWIIPLWIAWKFYQLLREVRDELAGIKDAIRDRNDRPSVQG